MTNTDYSGPSSPVLQPSASSEEKTSCGLYDNGDEIVRSDSERLILEYLPDTPVEKGLSLEESLYKHLGIVGRQL